MLFISSDGRSAPDLQLCVQLGAGRQQRRQVLRHPGRLHRRSPQLGAPPSRAETSDRASEVGSSPGLLLTNAVKSLLSCIKLFLEGNH